MTPVKAEPRDAALPPSPTPELNLDWASYLRSGEYRRALAAARVGQSAAAPALELLHDVAEQVRAHRYPQAQRALNRLREEIALPNETLTPLRQHVELARLSAGLEVLVRAEQQRFAEPAELRAALGEAFDEPLTRAEALNSVGVLHAIHDETDEARRYFEQAITADPGHYRALSNLGNLALHAGKHKEAEALQRQALALNADFAGAHHNLGVALRKQGRLHDSVGAIRKGQRLAVRHAREEQLGAGSKSPLLNPKVLRVLGLLLAVLVFYLLLRGH